MITANRLLLLACLLATPLQLQAQGFATPVVSDSRIKTYVYNENDVYRLTTHYGYQLNIEFGLKERIETISVGDRTGWQIIPSGGRIFIRAMEDKAHTNMTVVTNRHAYQFDLMAQPKSREGAEDLVYVVRFFYPEQDGRGMVETPPPAPAAYPVSAPATMAPVAAAPIAPVASYPAIEPATPPAAPVAEPAINTPAPAPMMTDNLNYNYTFTGSQAQVPIEIFDDGAQTYLRMPTGVSNTAYFGKNPGVKEIALQPMVGNQYLTLNGVYSQLILRGEHGTTTIYNEALNGK